MLRIPMVCGLGVLVSVFAMAQEKPAETFAKGKAALAAGDCATAVKTFDSIANVFRDDPIYLFNLARAHECDSADGHFDRALDYYRRYDAKMPGQAQTVEKIGQLLYQIDKAKKDKAAAAVQQHQTAVDNCLQECRLVFQQCTHDASVECDRCMASTGTKCSDLCGVTYGDMVDRFCSDKKYREQSDPCRVKCESLP